MSRTYKARDPKPKHRDPKPMGTDMPEIPNPPPKAIRKPRRYIPASAPTICPDCGHNTRMDDGRHIDPLRKRILEYRTCAHCGALLAAGRSMTPVEIDRLCSRVDAIAEYEATDGRV